MFETSDSHGSRDLQPIKVATRKEDIYRAAREMVADLDWEVVGSDDDRLEITCRRKGGLLGGTATIRIHVDGPEGIPSATVHVKSTTEGGLLNRDKANVAEFVRPFHRRVC